MLPGSKYVSFDINHTSSESVNINFDDEDDDDDDDDYDDDDDDDNELFLWNIWPPKVRYVLFPTGIITEGSYHCKPLTLGEHTAQKWSFALRISSCGFGHTYWGNP